MIILHCYFDVVMITRRVKTKLKDGAVLFFEKSRYYGYAKIRADRKEKRSFKDGGVDTFRHGYGDTVGVFRRRGRNACRACTDAYYETYRKAGARNRNRGDSARYRRRRGNLSFARSFRGGKVLRGLP